MQFDDIRAFVAGAEARSVSPAARELCLTQPAVTRRVQHLEGALGGALCDRRRRPVAVTDAGRAVLDRRRRVLHAVRDVRSAPERARSRPHRAIRRRAAAPDAIGPSGPRPPGAREAVGDACGSRYSGGRPWICCPPPASAS